MSYFAIFKAFFIGNAYIETCIFSSIVLLYSINLKFLESNLDMTSLIKPINRCLSMFRQANMAIVGIRFNSSDKPSTGKMDTPIQKEAIDPNVDPKETCKFTFRCLYSMII